MISDDKSPWVNDFERHLWGGCPLGPKAQRHSGEWASGIEAPGNVVASRGSRGLGSFRRRNVDNDSLWGDDGLAVNLGSKRWEKGTTVPHLQAHKNSMIFMIFAVSCATFPSKV